MGPRLEGGCACGAVRYALRSASFDAGWCHCRICQRISGAPAMAFATVSIADFALAPGSGSATCYRSSHFGRRLFCSQCGSSLAMRVDHQPETIDFTIATLDDPEAIAPAFHIFDESRITWFDAGDDLPRHARFRHDTRGLDGGDPPPGPRTS